MAQERQMAFVWGRLGLGLCLAGAASLSFVLANVETVLKADLSSALSAAPVNQALDVTTSRQASGAIAWAASEDEWLGFAGRPQAERSVHGIDVKPVSWPDTVVDGDRMTLPWQGTERVFDIVEVKTVAQGPTRIDTRITSEPRGGLLMVTGRLAGQEDGSTIRFVIDQPGDSDAGGLQPVKTRTTKSESLTPAAFGPPRTL